MNNELNPYVRRVQLGEVAPPPISTTLGGRIVSLAADGSRIECEYAASEGFLNPAGQVQGGMLAAMLDDVTAWLVTAALAEHEHCATLNLNTSFLRAAGAGPLRGIATLARRGRNVCNADGQLWQGDKLVATASAVCMVARGG
ncbi:PaaI family thioesterase [Paraburkholderia sp. MMS20-SJTR3]|uniref:PaaI family thioesterase n=1 Tax=Paraburkholderia sejongensis TaxID=2886946 RepID=A0ABS8K121_9BURK|nr:PaaI family thioesterase [Paraburkholderia sp. MMS20-SJTR3]MCC8395857.1 PaaI family thioesterase [Paraburkholderia sp. MMS20-SJTR3]